jgi:hypothetical protein
MVLGHIQRAAILIQFNLSNRDVKAEIYKRMLNKWLE